MVWHHTSSASNGPDTRKAQLLKIPMTNCLVSHPPRILDLESGGKDDFRKRPCMTEDRTICNALLDLDWGSGWRIRILYDGESPLETGKDYLQRSVGSCLLCCCWRVTIIIINRIFVPSISCGYSPLIFVPFVLREYWVIVPSFGYLSSHDSPINFFRHLSLLFNTLFIKDLVLAESNFTIDTTGKKQFSGIIITWCKHLIDTWWEVEEPSQRRAW